MNEKLKNILNYVYVFLAGIGAVLLVLLGRRVGNDNGRNNNGIDSERDRIDGAIHNIDSGLTKLSENNTGAGDTAGSIRDLHKELDAENRSIERVRLELATANREVERSNLNVTDRLQRTKDLDERNIRLLRELQKRVSKGNDED